MQRITVIDSHTGGEPTRVVVAGGPDLGTGPLAERAQRFRNEFDTFRSCVVNEPRGSDVLVGALLCEPCDPTCAAGVIFFNNVGYLGMCGHGTIGLAVTLAYQGRIRPGMHRIETPVGVVRAELHSSGDVTVHNVLSYRFAKDVEVDVEGWGRVMGDVAWGGNWFFLTEPSPFPLTLQHLESLSNYAWAVREALRSAAVCGAGRAEIDHIEISGPPLDSAANSRNFVLCPGRSYDRSPCGTGTSAKLACLFADGKLAEGEVWRQESLIGSVFEGTVSLQDHSIHPSIKGAAYVNADAWLLFDDRDPLQWGIRI